MRKLSLAMALASATLLAGCGSVDTGNVGLWNRFGQIDDEVAQPGVYGVNIFTTSLEEMSVMSTPWKNKTPIYTKDIQTGTVDFNVTTSLNPSSAVKMRKTVGLEWREKILPQVVESTIKDVFGRYDAADAIAKRAQIQNGILADLRKALRPRGINVDDFQLTNIDYSDAFEDAVEKAQVATQKATEARNATVRVEEEAKQTKIKAQAEAESIRVQADAISANPAIVKLRWVEKWDGAMPATVYCSPGAPCVQGQ